MKRLNMAGCCVFWAAHAKTDLLLRANYDAFAYNR